jgi:hypothetical protein
MFVFSLFYIIAQLKLYYFIIYFHNNIGWNNSDNLERCLCTIHLLIEFLLFLFTQSGELIGSSRKLHDSSILFLIVAKVKDILSMQLRSLNKMLKFFRLL